MPKFWIIYQVRQGRGERYYVGTNKYYGHRLWSDKEGAAKRYLTEVGAERAVERMFDIYDDVFIMQFAETGDGDGEPA